VNLSRYLRARQFKQNPAKSEAIEMLRAVDREKTNPPVLREVPLAYDFHGASIA
jgi:hypothetical protein